MLLQITVSSYTAFPVPVDWSWRRTSEPALTSSDSDFQKSTQCRLAAVPMDLPDHPQRYTLAKKIAHPSARGFSPRSRSPSQPDPHNCHTGKETRERRDHWRLPHGLPGGTGAP